MGVQPGDTPTPVIKGFQYITNEYLIYSIKLSTE